MANWKSTGKLKNFAIRLKHHFSKLHSEYCLNFPGYSNLNARKLGRVVVVVVTFLLGLRFFEIYDIQWVQQFKVV